MAGDLIRRGETTKIHIGGRVKAEAEAGVPQPRPGLPGAPEAGRGRKDPPLGSWGVGGAGPCGHADHRLLASRNEKKGTCVVSATQFVAICCGSARKLTIICPYELAPTVPSAGLAFHMSARMSQK